MNGLISTKDTFDWLHICLNNKKNLDVQSGISGMIGMTGISGKLGISDIIIHCCMKCPQILREKTSSEKYTVFSL